MEKFGKAVVKARIPILILAFILLIPSALGYFHTRTNYDILTYLPKDIETMKGQDILAKDFGTGAFSTVVVEGMTDKDIADHVYIEPLTVPTVKHLIEVEKPDSILPTLGGQNALNIAMALDDEGFLEAHNVKTIGTNCATIKEAEDRELFKELMELM